MTPFSCLFTSTRTLGLVGSSRCAVSLEQFHPLAVMEGAFECDVGTRLRGLRAGAGLGVGFSQGEDLESIPLWFSFRSHPDVGR